MPQRPDAYDIYSSDKKLATALIPNSADVNDMPGFAKLAHQVESYKRQHYPIMIFQPVRNKNGD